MFGVTFSIILQLISLYSLTTVSLIIIPSIFGADLGIRHVYIKLLMKVFKWGTATIEEKRKSDENLRLSEETSIISKENSINHLTLLSENGSDSHNHKKFELSDVVYLIKSGIEAVIDDEVTKRFRAEELSSWNLLTRTNVQHEFISIRLSILYFIGVILRYCVLLPIRLFITVFAMVWLIATMLPLAYTKDSTLKRKIAYYVNVVSFRIICRGFTAVVTYHDRENIPKNHGICVANHTTVLDAAILMQDRPYAILGQIHGGYLGWVMRMMSRATKHVWFERSEARDRRFVSRRIMEHVSDANNYPVLLFPEGTCINNTSVMMFKKGSFEIPTTIYPVAIKYNAWFGDAFWNSSKHSMIQYLLVVMTSWAIVADVWYLPPMRKRGNESAIQFAGRVKAVIAKRGGLVDCVWDGQLKRMHVKESYREEKRKELGEIFATNEPNFEENGKPLDSVSEEPIFDETSNNESEDATENVLEMKKFPFEDKSENIENSNNEATVLSTLQGDQSSSNETVVKKSDLEVNSAYENDELMHSFESLESLPNSENTLEQSSNFESTSENFEQNSLSTSPAKLVSPNHIKGALAPG